MSTSAENYWKAFLAGRREIPADTPYQVWYFGNSGEQARELAGLVLSGKKTATASLLETNRLEPEKAPIDDGYSVVTDFEGEPMCIIQTTQIDHLPFEDVDAAFAFDEGEDDRTLQSWRDGHRAYFTKEAARLGFDFDENSIVCCERFRLLFPK